MPVVAELKQSLGTLGRRLASALVRTQQLRRARFAGAGQFSGAGHAPGMLIEQREQALSALAARLGASHDPKRATPWSAACSRWPRPCGARP